MKLILEYLNQHNGRAPPHLSHHFNKKKNYTHTHMTSSTFSFCLINLKQHPIVASRVFVTNSHLYI